MSATADLEHEAALLGRQGNYQEAIALYDRILLQGGNRFDALNNRGVNLANLHRLHEAIACFEQALTLQPDSAEPWNNRGLALAKLGHLPDALASFQRAIDIRPDYVEALANAGDLLASLGRADEALRVFDRLSALAPDSPGALIRLGNILTTLRRYEQALACYEKVLAADPAHVDALNNRGTMLDKLGKPAEALASYDQALELRPGYIGAMRNRAVLLGRLGRFDEALDSFAEMRMIQPDYADAQAQEAILRLRMGDYRAGFLAFEWRWLERSMGPERRNFGRPLWTGRQSLKGRSILVHAEQGLGDTIQFMRYVPLLAERGAQVTLELPAVLLPLAESLKGAHRLIAYGTEPPGTDFHIPLLSLPLAFGTALDSVPSGAPYLAVNPESVERWRAKLREGRDKLVGICWRGNPDYPSDVDRSIRFADFAPLMTAPGVRFISLQKEMTEEERRLAASLPMTQPGLDFKSTAEIVGSLDWLITVDTAWSHWAGAIGVPFWLLLPYSPHWAWLTEREDSPWYPSARLFRQVSPGDWKTVIRKVRDAFPTGTPKKKARSS